MAKITTEIFIERATEVHKGKYDYSKVVYVNNHTKVCIICPIHGEFWQTPNSHLSGNGCPACSGLQRITTEVFIERSEKVHNKKYKYYKTNVKNIRDKVTITCPIHGDFEQSPKNHMNGQGCPKCGLKYAKEWRKNNYKGFIDTSIERFGDSFMFPNIVEEYENSHSKITFICKKCGNVFTKIACDHLTSKNGGCMKCTSNSSFDEIELGNIVKDILPNDTEIRFRDRSVLESGSELDIYIPSLKLGIEYNGIFWHSEKMPNKNKNYHILKTEECKTKGIKIIQIFEDEFINHKEIVVSKLKHLLGVNNDLDKIYARKCSITKITKKECEEFLNKNHIQGYVPSSLYIGCFFNEKLIGVMSFNKFSFGMWELTRFATDINYVCCGVAGKLFKYFVRKYKPYQVKSFADRRWTINEENNLYLQIGFHFSNYTLPDYKYIQPKVVERYHKFGFRKQTLHKKYGLPLTMTEKEMTQQLGFYRIWDCGLIKYVWCVNDNYNQQIND